MKCDIIFEKLDPRSTIYNKNRIGSEVQPTTDEHSQIGPEPLSSKSSHHFLIVTGGSYQRQLLNPKEPELQSRQGQQLKSGY